MGVGVGIGRETACVALLSVYQMLTLATAVTLGMVILRGDGRREKKRVNEMVR